MNKRGLATIVIVLIMVLLGLVAVGIIWAVVKGIIDVGVGQIDISAKCMKVDVKAISVVNVGETNYTVVLEREAGGDEIGGVKIIFTNATAGINSQHLVPGNMEPHEIKTESNIATGIVNANKVEVVVYFKDEGEKEQYCSRSNSYSIKDEGANGNGNGNGGNGGEPCIPDSDPCGDWICGIVANGTCGNINCPPGCTGNDTCINGVCVPENCVNETQQQTCGDQGRDCGNWTNNCGYIIDCGPCEGNCVEGVCIIETSVNNGTVEDVWPPGADEYLYFGSTDLPTDIDYTYYYVKFPGSGEMNCLLIAKYTFPISGYNKSHIAFNFPANITSGDNYEIWESSDCGS